MSHVIKTAISLQESVFRKMDALAHKTHIPRSKLFEKAAIDFLHKQKNPKLLQRLNAAYDDTPDPNEKRQQESMRANQRKLMKGQW